MTAPPLQAQLEATERTARRLSDAAFAAWDALINRRAPGTSGAANVLMDGSYVASTTARLVSHAADYQLHVLAMQAAVCRRIARRCAELCDREQGAAMATCASVARACAAACDELLGLLWDGSLAEAVRDEEEAAAPISEAASARRGSDR